MKKLFTYFAVVSFVTLSCSKQSENINLEKQSSQQIILTDDEIRVLNIENKHSKLLNTDEIHEEVDNALALLGNKNQRLSLKSSARRVNKIRALTNSSNAIRMSTSKLNVSSNFSDTLAYVVDFADDAGFLLIAADRRVEVPLLAIVDSGSLQDTIYNIGLGAFLGMAELGIKQSIYDYEKKKDSISTELRQKGIALPQLVSSSSYGDDEYDYEGEVYYESTLEYENRVIQKKNPLIVTKWSQNTPFNDNVKYKNCSGGTAPAGCVPVAIGQLMAFWKYPTTFYSQSYNWTSIIQYPTLSQMQNTAPASVKTQVATLMDQLGQRMSSDYSCETTGTDSDKATSVLTAAGFSHGNMQSYNYNTVVSSINSGQPVFGRGNSGRVKVLGIVVGYTGGHAWIIDGYLTTETKYNYIAERRSRTDGAIIDRWTGSNVYNSHYHHVNWGWGGYRDGYFSAYYFDASNFPDFNSNVPVHSKSLDSDGEPNNYQYNLEIIPFIRK